MKDQERSQFGQVLRNLSLVFPKEVSKQVVELYWHALKSYELDRISMACEHIVKERSNSFFPNPAEIKEAIRALPVEEWKQIPETTTQTAEDKQRAGEMFGFCALMLKRDRPKDIAGWNVLMEEFRLDRFLTDERAEEMVLWYHKNLTNKGALMR